MDSDHVPAEVADTAGHLPTERAARHAPVHLLMHSQRPGRAVTAPADVAPERFSCGDKWGRVSEVQCREGQAVSGNGKRCDEVQRENWKRETPLNYL